MNIISVSTLNRMSYRVDYRIKLHSMDTISGATLLTYSVFRVSKDIATNHKLLTSVPTVLKRPGQSRNWSLCPASRTEPTFELDVPEILQ